MLAIMSLKICIDVLP